MLIQPNEIIKGNYKQIPISKTRQIAKSFENPFHPSHPNFKCTFTFSFTFSRKIILRSHMVPTFSLLIACSELRDEAYSAVALNIISSLQKGIRNVEVLSWLAIPVMSGK